MESLLGVGCKIVNVVMSVGFGILVFVVDIYVECICKYYDIVKKFVILFEVEKRVMDILLFE